MSYPEQNPDGTFFFAMGEREREGVAKLVGPRMVDLMERAVIVNNEMTVAQHTKDQERFNRCNRLLARLVREMDKAVVESDAPAEFKYGYITEVLDRRPPEMHNYESAWIEIP